MKAPRRPGRYELEILTSTHAPYRTVVDVRAGATTDLGELPLSPGVALRGRVVDPEGTPVRGARVRFGWEMEPVPVDADGRFGLAHLTPGSVDLRVEAPGFPPDVFPLSAGDRDIEHVVRLGRGGVVRGRIDAAPETYDRFSVRVQPAARPRSSASRNARPDADGRFEVRIAAGAVEVLVFDGDYGQVGSATATVPEGGETEVVVTPSRSTK
jgi:hypothetical protein